MCCISLVQIWPHVSGFNLAALTMLTLVRYLWFKSPGDLLLLSSVTHKVSATLSKQ